MPKSRTRSKSKIYSRKAVSNLVKRKRAKGLKVVFTNGCFDILHVGHVGLLERAKKLGDILIVGLNSDSSVSGLKGPKRPLVPQRARATVIAALECVDFVTVFGESTPANLIKVLKPDFLVKGADWGSSKIVGSDVVRANGGKVVRVKIRKGFSTTELIKRIRRG